YEEWNETPLGAASHVGNRAVAEYLLSQGATLTICTAAMLGMTQSVAEFLKADPGQARATGAHGIPVLTHAAISGKTEIADLLVANGGGERVDARLVNAAQFGHPKMVEWLLARGADPNARNYEDKTALRLALDAGHTQVAELLSRHEALES